MARDLNDRTINSLRRKPAKPGKTRDHMDGQVRGFGVRVNEHGTITFFLNVRFPGSANPARRAIGRYGEITLTDARETARQWKALVAKGIDPATEAERQRAAELRKNAHSFAAVAENFITRKLPAQRKGQVVERIIRKELLPTWAARPITEIDHRDVRDLVQRVVDRGAASFASNVFDAIAAVFNYAASQDAIESSPCRLLKRSAIVGPKKHRQRVLCDIELQAFWRASGKLDYPFGPFFRLLLLTGCRLDEVAGARWREFDLTARTWTIPAERYKSDAEHVVPLTDDAMAVLESLPRFANGDYLFSLTAGERPVSSFSKPKARLDALMAEVLGELRPFVSHDLRRTVRTRLSALKVQDHVAELVIGHARKGLQRVYDMHRFEGEKREALGLWAAKLRSIVDPPTAGNVVSIDKARA